MRLDLRDDEDADVATGLVALVVTVVELVVDALEREAVRRMEAGQLTDEEVERVGRTLMELEAEVERIKEEQDIAAATDEFRAELDGLIRQAVVETVEREP